MHENEETLFLAIKLIRSLSRFLSIDVNLTQTDSFKSIIFVYKIKLLTTSLKTIDQMLCCQSIGHLDYLKKICIQLQMNYDALTAIQAAQPPPPYHIAILLPGEFINSMLAARFMTIISILQLLQKIPRK